MFYQNGSVVSKIEKPKDLTLLIKNLEIIAEKRQIEIENDSIVNITLNTRPKTTSKDFDQGLSDILKTGPYETERKESVKSNKKVKNRLF